MIKYYRQIGNIIINIIIDDIVWSKANKILNSLVSTYALANEENQVGCKVHNYYILDKENMNNTSEDKSFIVDINDTNCFFFPNKRFGRLLC